MTPVSINRIVNSPIFQHALTLKRADLEKEDNKQTAHAEAEAAKQIREATRKAAKRLIFGLKSDDEKIAIRSAESILDRGGIPKVTKNEGAMVQQTFNLSAENLAIIQQTLEMESN